MAEKGYAKATMSKLLFLVFFFSDNLVGKSVNTIEEVTADASSFVHDWVRKSNPV